MTDTKHTTKELDEELVENIVGTIMRLGSLGGSAEKIYKYEIRKLLQSRQQSKPRVTRGEITEWVEISNREYEAAISHIINCLKSKGVEVGE